MKHNQTPNLFLLLLSLLVFMLAASFRYKADFFAINGAFQNFNPVRRLLAGQIPYKDFVDYLGMGHLYIGTFFTAVFGGDFRASLIAFNFLSSACVVLISYVIGSAVLGSSKKSAVITVFSVFILVWLWKTGARVLDLESEDKSIITSVYLYFSSAVYCMLFTGNSARLVRAMVLPLSSAALYAGWRMAGNARRRPSAALLGIGILSGFMFIWSNDYGISCWFCMMAMTFAAAFSRSRKISSAVLCTVAELLFSSAGIFIAASIAGRGNFMNWLISTFSSGSYQFWYYNSPKSIYIWDIDYAVLLTNGTVSLVYLYKIFADRGRVSAIWRYGIPCFFNMAVCCAANEYRLLSGGFLREAASAVFLFTLIFEAVRIFVFKIRQNTAKYLSCSA